MSCVRAPSEATVVSLSNNLPLLLNISTGWFQERIQA